MVEVPALGLLAGDLLVGLAAGRPADVLEAEVAAFLAVGGFDPLAFFLVVLLDKPNRLRNENITDLLLIIILLRLNF